MRDDSVQWRIVHIDSTNNEIVLAKHIVEEKLQFSSNSVKYSGSSWLINAMNLKELSQKIFVKYLNQKRSMVLARKFGIHKLTGYPITRRIVKQVLITNGSNFNISLIQRVALH